MSFRVLVVKTVSIVSAGSTLIEVNQVGSYIPNSVAENK